MKLGFADELGERDGKTYAIIWMTVPDVDTAKGCHASVRMLPLVKYDISDFIEYPNRDYRIQGRQDSRAVKKAKWYRVEGEVEL